MTTRWLRQNDDTEDGRANDDAMAIVRNDGRRGGNHLLLRKEL